MKLTKSLSDTAGARRLNGLARASCPCCNKHWRDASDTRRRAFTPSLAPNPRPPRAFTLVELLVVITIIGILIALLLPAVQAAREAARQVQCKNNFKQVGIAMHNYHDFRGSFPPGCILWHSTMGQPDCMPYPTTYYAGWGWGTFILPFIEKQAVFDRYDFDSISYVEPWDNRLVGQTIISTYVCPSDPQGSEMVTVSARVPPLDPETRGQRRTNMAGVVDSVNWTCDLKWPKYFGDASYMANGIMGNREPCHLRDIRDGTSTTLMIGEITGGGPGSYQGEFWTSWAITDTSYGINSGLTIPGGGTFGTGMYAAMHVAGFSSFHPGGCHFCMGDGSVHFFSEHINSDVLAALTTRSGGEVISASSY